jgi:integrase
MKTRGLHRLTAKGVQALGPGWHCDGGQLYALVGKGTGSWVFRSSAGNLGLGSMSTVSLSEARDRAHAYRVQLAAGIDPRAKREADRTAAKVIAAKSISFDQCAAAYVAAHGQGWRSNKHRAEWVATLATYASPIIGGLPVSAVDVALVLRILEPLWPTKNETASRVRGRIEVVLDWARARGYRDGENPARWRGHLKMLLPAPRKVHRVVHHPALAYAELPRFMAALRARPGVAERALEFGILTAARSGEIRGAVFSEINIAEKLWTIPPERMKAGREHRVPLSPRALAIVREMQLIQKYQPGSLLFPGARKGRRVADVTITATLRQIGIDTAVHGFRATFKTWASERTNFQREVVESALAHINGDKTEAAYQRSDLLDKRRRLMDAWSAYASAAPVTADVIPIGRVS